MLMTPKRIVCQSPRLLGFKNIFVQWLSVGGMYTLLGGVKDQHWAFFVTLVWLIIKLVAAPAATHQICVLATCGYKEGDVFYIVNYIDKIISHCNVHMCVSARDIVIR